MVEWVSKKQIVLIRLAAASELDVLSHVVVQGAEHVVAWESLEEGLAVSGTNFSELAAVADLGRSDGLDDGLHNVSFASDNQEWDVKEGAHVSVLGAGNVPAVVTEFPVAAAEFESEQPAVDDEAESLVVKSLNVAEDHQRQHEDVQDPNEDSSAWFANETNRVEEDKVEDPVESGESCEDAPEW